MKKDDVDRLAIPCTLVGMTQLTPAVTENAPTAGQVVINGAFAFDNVFMVNGVDITDNVFARPQDLFVEDAIEETQVLTSGISAEFGRFGGGVVNAISKSGGNQFAGSLRINFLNPSWTTQTPFEESRSVTHIDKVSQIYETTFGGPIVQDRLWFFTSGRYGKVENQVTLPQTGVGLTSLDTNKRGEIKLTGKLADAHTIQGGYLNDPRTRTNNSGVQSLVIDPRSEVDRENPNWYLYTNYRGVLNGSLLGELQYAERRFETANDGGTSTNILDSPFFALNCACVYNAPYFDAADPQQKNNRQLTGSVMGSWSKSGRHDTKAGYEFYRSQLAGGGSQSSTSYVFRSDFLSAGGRPVLDAQGRLIPVFVPGVSGLGYFPAVRGAVLNINNNALYVQDRWVINNQWSADLGLRYEHVHSEATGDITGVKNGRIVPRLALGYDVQGNGDHVVHVTYGQYAGRYIEPQLVANSSVGNPADIEPTYRGPAGQGRDFSPGFDPANYPITPANASVSDPRQNVQIDSDTKSPLTHEFSTSYGVNLGAGRGYAEAGSVYRKTTSLIEDFLTRADGVTNVVVNGVSAGSFTNKVFRNTDLGWREYQGMVFQSRVSVNNDWTVNGHYTLQLKNDGNYEGEATNQPGKPSIIGNYPEAFTAARSYPDGRLQDFQRHRLRLWSTYIVNMNRFGDLSVSGLWRVDSGRVFSLAARNQAITAAQRAILAAAGYPDVPAATDNHVFFGDRGSETFKGYGLFDTSITYNIPLLGSLRPWFKLDIYNLLDNRKLIAWNTTVSQNAAGARDELGLATSYTPGATFGTATGNTVTNLYATTINAFPVSFNTLTPGAVAGGRTIRFALGFRF